MKFTWLVVAVLLLSASLVQISRADEVEDAEHTEQKIEQTRRNAESHDRQSFEVDVGTRKVKVEMQSKTKTDSGDKSWDKLEFEMEEKPYGLDTEFSYQSKSKSGDDESHNKFTFKLRAFRIREYQLSDTNLSNPVSTYIIGAGGGSNMQTNNWDAPVVDQTSTPGLLIATFKTSDGVFKAVGKLVLRKTIVNNITLIPDLCKFDYEINNYPYAGQNTVLALEARFKVDTKQKYEQESEDEATGEGKKVTTVVRVKNDANALRAGHFEWRPTIKADNNTVAVEAVPISVRAGDKPTDNDDRVENGIAFVFKTTDRVSKFLWDPEVGVSYLTASGVGTISVSMFALLASIVVALLAM